MKLSTTRSRMLTVAGIGVAAVVVIGGTATAASQITSHQLATGSVNSRVVKDGSLRTGDLNENVNKLLHKAGVSGLQADEPYGQDVLPNANLTQSDSKIPAGTTQVVWVACPTGKFAVGGGFRLGDAGAHESDTPAQAAYPNLQVVASEASFEKDGHLSLADATQVTSYGSYRPNAWAVTVTNSGATDQSARAQVICASVPRP
jgi:hypothetical protein